MLCLVKMASRTNLHDDLTSAFIRYREGQYDRTLDRKKPQLILSQCVEIFIIMFFSFFALMMRMMEDVFLFFSDFREDKSRGRKDP